MALPGTDGTDSSLQRMASRIGVLESVTASATASATNSTAGAVTLNAGTGIIVSPNLTTSLTYTLTVSNSLVSTTDIVWIGVQNGSNTAAVQLSTGLVTLGNGSFSVVLNNVNTQAHNGTVNIVYEIIKMVAATSVD